MDSLRYLAVLVACTAVTLPLEFRLGARVYRRPRQLAECAVLTYEALGVLRARRPLRQVGGGDDHA